jgi:hypothetical protein
MTTHRTGGLRQRVLHRCPVCRQSFPADELNQIYCSRICYWSSKRRPPLLRVCAGSGQRPHTFLAGGRGRKSLGARFCSRSCASRFRQAHCLRRSTVRRLSRGDRRWFGAMLRAEGHISRTNRILVEVGNTRRDIVLDCQRIAGAGSIGKDRPRPGEAPFWRWRLGRVDSIGLLRQLIGQLGSKERDGLRAIARYEAMCNVAGPSLATLLRSRTPAARRLRSGPGAGATDRPPLTRRLHERASTNE